MTHYTNQVTTGIVGGALFLLVGAYGLVTGLPGLEPLPTGLGAFFVAVGSYALVWAVRQSRNPEGKLLYCKACKKLYTSDHANCPFCGALADPTAWWW